MSETIRCDIAVIGGGPAGLAAGLYAARGGMKVLIFERQMSGGQIVTTDWVENYPAFPQGISGADLGDLMTRQATGQGAELVLFVNITSVRSNLRGQWLLESDTDASYEARAVIFASGAVPRKLGIPGEDYYTGRGVSWCATCDGAFYRDKTVAVIGGGDAALEEALFLTKFARKVYVVHRRCEFRAAAIIVQRAAAADKLEFVLSSVAREILGDGTRVTGLALDDARTDCSPNHLPRHSRESGNPALSSTEEIHTLAVDGVFEFVGVDPVNELLAGLDALTSTGYALVNADGSLAGADSCDGLFAAGDLTAGPLKQVVTAAASGALAGFSALQYLA
jgi:thioredoxin reductase (NADPH)